MIHSPKEWVLWTIWEHSAKWKLADEWGCKHETLMRVLPSHLKGNGKYFMPCSAGLQVSSTISSIPDLLKTANTDLGCFPITKLKPASHFIHGYWVITRSLYLNPSFGYICSQSKASNKWNSQTIKRSPFGETDCNVIDCTLTVHGDLFSVHLWGMNRESLWLVCRTSPTLGVAGSVWTFVVHEKEFIPAYVRNLKYFKGVRHLVST